MYLLIIVFVILYLKGKVLEMLSIEWTKLDG